MRIGQVARLAGVSKDTVRFYTKLGLVQARQTQAGTRSYADYGPEVASQVESIRKSQAVGFTLAEIKLLIDETTPDCNLTKQQRVVLETKYQEVKQKQTQLTELAALLYERLGRA